MIEAARLTAIVEADTKRAERDIGGFGERMGGLLTGAAKAATAALVGVGVAAGGMAVLGIRAASDLAENMNKVNVVFGDSAAEIRAWADNAAQSFGISESAALASAGTFGNLFVSMGIGQDAASDMSQGIVQLAADLGSFNNLGTEEVLEKIRAGLVGETEPLRSLGVNLDAASIAAKAMAMGLAESEDALTPAAKAQAAYALILEQTKTAQGDFANTKDGMANSLKIIQASFADLQVEIGQRLLPAVAPLIAAFAANMPRALDLASRALDRIMGVVTPVADTFVDFGRYLRAVVEDGDTLNDWLSHLPGFLQPVARLVGNVVETFVELGRALREGDWSGAFRALADGARAHLSILADVAGEIVSTIAGALGSVDWSGVATTLLDGLLAGVEGVADVGVRVAAWAVGQFQAIDWSGLGATFVDGLLAGVEAIADFGTRIASWAVGQFQAIDWSGLGAALVAGLLAGVATVTDFGTQLVGWMATTLAGVDWLGLATAVKDGILGGLFTLVDWGGQFVGWIAATVASVDWSGLATTIKDGVLGAWFQLLDWGQQAVEWVSGALSSVDWTGAATAIRDGIVGAASALDWTSLAETISGALSSLTDSSDALAGFAERIDGILDAFQPLAEELGGRWAEIVADYREAWQGVIDAFAELNLEPVLDALRTLGIVLGGAVVVAVVGITEALGLFVELMSVVAPRAATIIVGAIESLAGTINLIADVVTGVVAIVRELIEGDFSGAWEAAKELVSNAVDNIGTILGGLPEAVGQILLDVASAVLSPLGDLVVDAGAKAGELVAAVVSALGRLLAEAPGVVSGFVGSVLGFFSDLLAEGTRLAGELVSGVISALGGLIQQAPSVLSEFVRSVAGFLEDLVADGARLVGDLVTGVVKILEGLPGRAVEAVGDLADDLLQAGRDLIHGLVQGITEALPDLDGILGTIGDKIGSIDVPFWSPIDEAGLHMGRAFIGQMAEGVGSGVPALATQLDVVGETFRSWSAELQPPAYDSGYGVGSRWVTGFADALSGAATAPGLGVYPFIPMPDPYVPPAMSGGLPPGIADQLAPISESGVGDASGPTFAPSPYSYLHHTPSGPVGQSGVTQSGGRSLSDTDVTALARAIGDEMRRALNGGA